MADPPHGEAQLFDGVLFDFTGVLTASPVDAVLGPALEAGIPLETFLPIALGPLDDDTDHPWHMLERGEISFEEYLTRLDPIWREAGLESFPEAPDPADMLAAFTPVPAMIDVVRACGTAGYATAIITNNIKEWGAWRSLIDADQLVDVVVDSCEVGTRKPNPLIFELTLARLGNLPADRCLFIDDFAWNIDGAAKVGLHTHLVTDQLLAAQELTAKLNLR